MSARQNFNPNVGLMESSGPCADQIVDYDPGFSTIAVAGSYAGVLPWPGGGCTDSGSASYTWTRAPSIPYSAPPAAGTFRAQKSSCCAACPPSCPQGIAPYLDDNDCFTFNCYGQGLGNVKSGAGSSDGANSGGGDPRCTCAYGVAVQLCVNWRAGDDGACQFQVSVGLVGCGPCSTPQGDGCPCSNGTLYNNVIFGQTPWGSAASLVGSWSFSGDFSTATEVFGTGATGGWSITLDIGA